MVSVTGHGQRTLLLVASAERWFIFSPFGCTKKTIHGSESNLT